MNKINTLVIGTVLLFVTISCSTFMKGKELAGAAIEKFHSQYNEKKFGDIYDQSDEEFKKSISEADWEKLIVTVHEKLGTVKNSKSTGWNVNTTNGLTLTKVTNEVEFSEGKGTEVIVFHIKDDKALLNAYTINSPLLITK